VIDPLVADAVQRARAAFQWRSQPILRATREIACPYSVVTRIELACEGSSAALFLKRVRAEGIGKVAAAQRVRVEYDVLVRLFEHFAAHERFAVPRPIALFPEQGAILTQEVPGRELMDLIGSSAKRYKFWARGAALRRYCFLAGAWLREFQTLTARGTGEFDIERLRRYCDARLDTLIEARHSGVDADFKRTFDEYLTRTHEQCHGKVHAMSGRHNDFSPHNVFVEGARIAVIDFGFFDYDSTLYDVCKFWFQLECLKSSPLFRPATVDALQASFFEGYGRSVDSCDPAFEIVASRFFVTRLATMVKGGMRRGPASWIDRRSYDWCLRWLNARCGERIFARLAQAS
jgi:tRNA A-37 threonylcarbamoyl transferase component Bud32